MRESTATDLDEMRSSCWIRACFVLHNMFINTADEHGESEDGEESDDDDDDDEPALASAASTADATRLRVMASTGLRPASPTRRSLLVASRRTRRDASS